MAQGLIAQARCNGQREVCRTPVAGLLVPGPINANLRLLERMSVTGPVRATQRLSMAAGYLSKHARGPSPSSQHTPGLRSMRRNGRPPECPQSQLSAGSRLESRIPQSAPPGPPCPTLSRSRSGDIARDAATTPSNYLRVNKSGSGSGR